MAKLTLHIVGDNSDALLKIKAVDQAAKNLSNTVIRLTVDDSGFESLDQSLKLSTANLKAQADLISKKLKEAALEEKKLAAEAAQAAQKTTQSIQQTESAVKKVTVSAENLIQKVLMLPAHTEEAASKVIALTEGIAQQFVTLASNEKYARIEAEKLLPVYERLAQAARNATTLTTVPGSGYSGYTSSGYWQSSWNSGYSNPYTRTPGWDAVYAWYQRQNPQLGSGINWTYGTGTPANDPNDIDGEFSLVEEGANRASKAFNTMRDSMSAAWSKMQEGSKLAEIMRDSLGNIVVKMAAWQVMGNIVGTVIRSLREAVSTLKEVDQELINIQKVSDLTASQIKKIGDSAYETASKYGVSAKEYLEAVYTFQKAGIGENSEKMAELATKTMLVGDTTAEVATRFLIAANAAWKFGGDVDRLSKLVDEADYINNNYATTLSDIATGLPIVGATAAQVGMTAEETMAAIGTIVASTGQTASKAATALRAIIMNLLGQTGELEDGTKVTEETIDSLNKVLNKYASESLAAAEAEGKLLNPLEAIAALAKAAEDPLVKETELFNILAGLGGKLRTTQLTALVNNLDMANSMLEGMADSAGTADREISIMLESWNAKTQILKNTVTQFISHLVDSNVVKGGIDFLTSMVKLLDSGVGKIAALSVALYGVGKAIIAIGVALKGASLVSLLSSPLAWSTAAAAAIYGIVTIIDALIVTTEEYAEKTQKALDKYKELDSQISANNEKIAENERLIEDANEAGRNDAYIIRLQNENRLLETQNKLLEANAQKEKDRAHQNAISGLQARSYRVGTGEYKTYTTMDELTGESISETVEVTKNANILEYVNYLIKLGQAGKDVSTELGDAIETLLVFQGALDTSKKEGEQYANAIGRATVYAEAYADSLNRTIKAAKESGNATVDLATATEQAAADAQTAVAVYSSMQEKLGPLSDAMAQLTAQGYMDEAAMKALITAYPDLESAITATADGFVISKEAIMENVLALWAEYSAINNNAAAASMVQILALNNENGAWAANTAEIKKNIAARIAALEAEQPSTHLIGNGYSGTYYGDMAISDAEAAATSNELAMLRGLLRSIDSYGAATTTTPPGGSTKSSTDTKLESLKDVVSLRKQELSYLTESGASEAQQISKMRQIQAALHDQAEYMRSIGADEKDILALSTEWWTYQNKINKALDTTADLLKEAADAAKAAKEEAIAYVEQMASAATGPMQAQLDALNAQKDAIKDAEEEEEKLLAVEKARIALENAQNERRIRQYNSKTGQWEFVADAQAVQKAREDLDDAQRQLNEYYRNRSISALEKNIKTIQGSYDLLKTAINDFAKEIEAGTLKYSDAVSYLVSRMAGTGLESLAASMGSQIQQAGEQKIIDKMKANSEAWWSADEAGRKDLAAQNLLLGESQGWNRVNGTWYRADGTQLYDSGGILHGIGGIKATRDDEMVLPPKMTSALLDAEKTGAFDAVLRHLGIVTAAGQSFAGFGGGTVAGSIGSQHNGDVYQIGGVTLTEQQARCMTVYDLANMARNLSLHSA